MHYNALSRNSGIDFAFAFVVVAQQSIDKAGGHIERRLRRVAMGRMARPRQDRHIDRAVTLLLRRLDLLDRAVLVVGTLDDEERHADITQRFRDVPIAKVRIEPRLAPGAEST